MNGNWFICELKIDLKYRHKGPHCCQYISEVGIIFGMNYNFHQFEMFFFFCICTSQFIY